MLDEDLDEYEKKLEERKVEMSEAEMTVKGTEELFKQPVSVILETLTRVIRQPLVTEITMRVGQNLKVKYLTSGNRDSLLSKDAIKDKVDGVLVEVYRCDCGKRGMKYVGKLPPTCCGKEMPLLTRTYWDAIKLPYRSKEFLDWLMSLQKK